MTAPTPTLAAGPGATPARSRRLALAVLCAAQLMIILDQNIVTVALPAIQQDLGFTQQNLVWTVNAYVVPFGGVLLLAGRLGDLVGRKPVFISGLLLFTAASLVCGLATSQTALVAARFAQGIGGGVTAACILGVIVTIFPRPGEQARAIGGYSFASAGGGAIGPLTGGLLTETVSWHWIFFINLPLGVAVAALAVRALPASRGEGLSPRTDFAGAALVTSGLMLTVYTIIDAETSGWRSARIIGLGALAVVLLTGFVVRQATASQPLLPLRLLRSRNVSGANAVQVLLIGAMFGFLYFGALLLRALGFDAIGTGLAFLPAALSIAVVSLFLSARLIGRFGARAVHLGGLVLIAVGFALLARVSADSGYALGVLPSALLLGVGFGAAMPSLMMLGMSGAEPADAGVASGLFNTTQQIGGAVGLAVLSALAATPAVLIDGYRVAFLGATVFVMVALALAFAALRTRGSGPPPVPVGHP